MIIRCFENGNLTMHHHWVPLKDISPHMPVAVMAGEDSRFLLHQGFDFNAIGTAAKRNITNKGGKKYGGSTISQQTAKNVFLWPGRSWLRKGLEVYFTALIEIFWSKQRIMEVYLNSIEMGNGIYGVDACAEYHFEKEAKDLTRRIPAGICGCACVGLWRICATSRVFQKKVRTTTRAQLWDRHINKNVLRYNIRCKTNRNSLHSSMTVNVTP